VDQTDRLFAAQAPRLLAARRAVRRRARRISIGVAADEKWNPPPLTPETPLSIVWANAGESTAVGDMIDRASLTAPDKPPCFRPMWIRLRIKNPVQLTVR